MRKTFVPFLIFSLGMILCFVLYQYNIKGIRRDHIIKTVEKVSESALIASLDGSYRVTKDGMNIVSGEFYEAVFEQLFMAEAIADIANEPISFAYEYLVEFENGEDVVVDNPDTHIEQGAIVKGIHNQVTIDGQSYSVRAILDIKNGRDES